MGALAQLSQSRVEAEPGRTATITITVRNTGTVVDRYTFEALGAAEPWVTFSPDALSLFPEASGTVNVILAPPRQPNVPAGPTPLGVRITSSEDPAGSVVEEATIDVGGVQRHHARTGAPGDERPGHGAEPAGRGQPFELQLPGRGRGNRPANGVAVQVPSSCGGCRPGQRPVRQGRHTAIQQILERSREDPALPVGPAGRAGRA